MPSSAVPESTILKPRDPALVDDNDWPDFLLTNVEITDPQSGELASLLRACSDNPLTLVGKLPRLTDGQQRKALINPKAASLLPAKLQVSNIQHYCYGQNDDGEAVMWAAGEAGWFQIQPARTYKSIHKNSSEAINILYFLADFYRDLKGRKVKSTPTETVFQEYMEDPSHHCSNEGQAEALFLRHREFLLECMLKGKENIKWKNTAIYEWLSQATSDSSSESDDEMTIQTPQGLNDSDNEQLSSRRFAGKSRSSLRPRSNKHSLKSMGRRRSIGEVEADETPTQPSTAASLKRKASGASGYRPRKRGDTSSAVQDSDLPSPSDSDGSGESPVEHPLPLRTVPKRTTASQTHEPILQIIEEALPSFEPQGPGGTWMCTFDGCSFTVYDAKKPSNRELIKEHYKTHALEKQAQLDLVYTEERPYLPVNNLIKRIREMAAAHKPAQPEDEPAVPDKYPKPIRRKY